MRQLIFLRKSDYLGCAVLLCLVCLFDLARFYLSSNLSLKYVYTLQTRLSDLKTANTQLDKREDVLELQNDDLM